MAQHGVTGDIVTPVQKLRHLALELLGNDTILYTTDPPQVSARGGTPESINIVDFGANVDPVKAFAQQKKANQAGRSPPMDSEFYTGWLTHWGEQMANTCDSPFFRKAVSTCRAACVRMCVDQGAACYVCDTQMRKQTCTHRDNE